MGTFFVDGRPVPFETGDNVLKAALKAGVEIPYFCYHDALGSLGACRLCALELQPDKEGQKPRIVISCQQPAQEGMQVSLEAESAKREHQAVIEFLMTNHPHDCPVCDEGGECHLQNMTVACGHSYRRYRGPKRTFPNQDLGPLVWQDMDRCITCYRCVRFYQQYALGDDFGAMRSRNEVFFGRNEDGPLENPFAGNLVEVCPTGTLTDKVFRRHYSRGWDLETAPGVCAHCSGGCNTAPGARHGTLRRVRSRHHPEINPWFICDRGRYGHRYVESPERPLEGRVDGRAVEFAEAINEAARRLECANGKIAGLGSPREDLEANVALQRLMRRIGVGFSAFTSPSLQAATIAAMNSAADVPSPVAMEQADAVLAVGDLTGHAPFMDLAVRQLVRQERPLFVLHTTSTALIPFAKGAMAVAPMELPEALKRIGASSGEGALSREIAAGLANAEKPLLVGVAETLGVAGVATLAGLAAKLPGMAQTALALPGPNAFGVALLDGDCEGVLNAVEQGKVSTLVVLGADPFGDDPGAGRWRAARDKLECIIVLDCLPTASARLADCFIPLAAWPERSGVFVNYQGLAQGFAQVFQRERPCPDGRGAVFGLAGRLGDDLNGDVETVIGQLLPERPTPGDFGQWVRLQPAKPPAFTMDVPANGAWQAELFTWYGADPLAAFAPELSSLAPQDGVRMAAGQAREVALASDQEIVIRGTGGELRLPVILEERMPAKTLALSRQSMAALGVSVGDPLDWEPR